MPKALALRKEELAPIMDQYVEFLKYVPVKRFAAQFVGKDEDTIAGWKKKIPEFAERCAKAESENVRKTYTKARPEWQLEKSFPEEFGPKVNEQNINILVTPIIGSLSVPTDNSNQKVIKAQQTNQSDPGRNVSEQDDIDSLIPD